MSWEADKCPTERQWLQIKGADRTGSSWNVNTIPREDRCSRKQRANQVKYSFQPQVWNSFTRTGRRPLGSLLSFSRSPQGENKAVKGALILGSLRQDFRHQRSAATTESSSQSTPGRIELTPELWRSPRHRHHQWAQWLWHFRVIGGVAPELVFSPYIKPTWTAQLNRLTVNQLLRGCVSISILEYGALIGKDQHIQ